MGQIDFKGKTFEIDEDGFIASFDAWCPEWVDYVKSSEGINELTDEHWQVIHVLQDYYKTRDRPDGPYPHQGNGLQAQVHL